MELQHSKMMGFMLQTLGVPQENTFQGNYRQRLQKLMTVNNLSSFIYSNVIPKSSDGQNLNFPVRLLGGLVNGKLQLRTAALTEPKELTGIGFLNRANHYLTVQNANGNWAIYDKHIDDGFVQSFRIENLDEETLPNTIYKQIYDEFVEAGFSLNPPKDGEDTNKLFTDISNAVQKQINEAFYEGVKLRVDVRQLDENGKEKNHFIAINNEDVSAYEIKLDVVLDAKGEVVIDHDTKNEYLKEFVEGLQKEASDRGYSQEEINVEALRQQVRDDFASEETKQNFYTKFIKGLLTDAVANYVEGVQATQKVGKHIWEAGTVNESTWHSSEEEHEQWPEYMQMHPLIGGGTDGVVDEIVGIPLAIRGLYDLATDEDQREALLGLFSKEGFDVLIEGIQESIEQLKNDPEQRAYTGSKTTVSVAAIFVGGAFVEAGKIAELLELITDKLNKYADPKTIEWFEKLKKANRTKVDEAEIQKFFRLLDEDLIAEIQEEALQLGVERGQKLTFKEIQVLWKRGNDFNTKARLDGDFRHNEIWLRHPEKKYPKGHKYENESRRFRLDSWDPDGDGSIVSRKATDLDKISKETFVRYLKEIKEKYPVDSKIANKDIGNKLFGKYKLEIPESNSSFERLQEYQLLAEQYSVEIIFRAE